MHERALVAEEKREGIYWRGFLGPWVGLFMKHWKTEKAWKESSCRYGLTLVCAKGKDEHGPFPQFPLAEHLECLIKWHLWPQWPVITPNYSDVFREFPYQLVELSVSVRNDALHVGILNVLFCLFVFCFVQNVGISTELKVKVLASFFQSYEQSFFKYH